MDEFEAPRANSNPGSNVDSDADPDQRRPDVIESIAGVVVGFVAAGILHWLLGLAFVVGSSLGQLGAVSTGIALTAIEVTLGWKSLMLARRKPRKAPRLIAFATAIGLLALVMAMCTFFAASTLNL